MPHLHLPRNLGTVTLLVVALLVAGLLAAASEAQTFTTLYNFTGPDGMNPSSSLVRDAMGNLYGTTAAGGVSGGYGTVFKIDVTGTETVLHSFNGTDGAYPGTAGLILDSAGNIYGTITYGGTSGGGAIFKVDTTGEFSFLYSFMGGADGEFPFAGVIRDSAGNFYGTTEAGSARNLGTVFKLDATGAETVLRGFSKRDGSQPTASLIRSATGNLYGTTSEGGAFGYGTVFELDSSGQEIVLHSFASGTDGSFPRAALVRDAENNLYGTTSYGGSYGLGTVFKLDSTRAETVLHSFAGVDGQIPEGSLIRDAAGNLYGTTYNGDSYYGTVFKLDPTGTETVLHSFTGPDGAYLQAGLIRDQAGNLYGTTFQGGSVNLGTVFKITP